MGRKLLERLQDAAGRLGVAETQRLAIGMSYIGGRHTGMAAVQFAGKNGLEKITENMSGADLELLADVLERLAGLVDHHVTVSVLGGVASVTAPGHITVTVEDHDHP